MKNLLLTALVLVGLSAKAQFFQHTYGSANDENLSSGVNTIAQGLGHFMAGPSQTTAAGQRGLLAVFADVNGAISGAPYFSNHYDVVDMGGTVHDVYNLQVFETNTGFGIIGVHNNPAIPASGAVFYLQLDNQGNPIGIFDYIPLPGTFIWHANTVGKVSKSATGNEVYVTGSVQANAPQVHVFGLKIDVNSGILMWSNIYDIPHGSPISREVGTDIIENPYNPLGNPEVMIVGFANGAGVTNDGFILRIDANNGMLALPWAIMFGSANSNDAIYSIAVANSNSGNNVGFVLAGRSDYNGSADFWLLKTDPTGWGVLWSTLHDYNSSGSFDECHDVIERFNTSNQYEYYMTGYTANGPIGGDDILVIKTDDFGNGVANGEFVYGSGNADRAMSLDQYNGTGADGLSTFGTGDFGTLGQSDFYLIKSYFDGNSGCNEKFSNPSPTTGPGIYYEYFIIDYNGFTTGPLLYSSSSASEKQLCYNTSIPGASNARMAPTAPKGDKEAIVLPNPMGQGSPVAFVELEAAMPATVEVAIYDMLGKQYYNGTHTLAKGNNQLPLDISNANMATGMYTVKVTGASIAQNILLIVK